MFELHGMMFPTYPLHERSIAYIIMFTEHIDCLQDHCGNASPISRSAHCLLSSSRVVTCTTLTLLLSGCSTILTNYAGAVYPYVIIHLYLTHVYTQSTPPGSLPAASLVILSARMLANTLLRTGYNQITALLSDRLSFELCPGLQ